MGFSKLGKEVILPVFLGTSGMRENVRLAFHCPQNVKDFPGQKTIHFKKAMCWMALEMFEKIHMTSELVSMKHYACWKSSISTNFNIHFALQFIAKRKECTCFWRTDGIAMGPTWPFLTAGRIVFFMASKFTLRELSSFSSYVGQWKTGAPKEVNQAVHRAPSFQNKRFKKMEMMFLPGKLGPLELLLSIIEGDERGRNGIIS